MGTINTYRYNVVSRDSAALLAGTQASLRLLFLYIAGITALLSVSLIQIIDVLQISIPIVILSIIVALISGLILNLIIS